MLLLRIFMVFLVLLMPSPRLSAFTLVNGPVEAKLPATAASPEVAFLWNGTHPSIKDKDKFMEGTYADLDDEAFFQMMLEIAFDRWNSVKGSFLRMKVELNRNVTANENDYLNVISVKSGLSETAAAAAMPLVENGRIYDCDIVLSSRSADAESLAYTILHEIGHCVGLGHNHTNYNAVMGYSRSNQALNLGADDKAGIIFLYPDPAYDSAAKEFLGCAVVALRLGHFSWVYWFLLFSPFALIFFNESSRGLSLRRKRIGNVARSHDGKL